ncbi:hypothetical protein RchiOBHm_Chr5g0058831 [Rosa chinensis]|uniref:Uncharacterized protein n=1 Tax=Rosa chinensis TaxID=74649 RepID=A0A2P6QH93_ROSCH|nr:hypothetical protein RchiOBHm_Chr5g0058831 [Rosa chinensis]
MRLEQDLLLGLKTQPEKKGSGPNSVLKLKKILFRPGSKILVCVRAL